MRFPPLLALLPVLALLLPASCEAAHEYCVIGAGPGGLQLAAFLEEAGHDYVVFERSPSVASFFRRFPRRRTLISVNRRFTGRDDPEFNLRHDWNSLLSSDSNRSKDLLFRDFSKEFYPSADDFVRYLEAFAERLRLRVRFGAEVVSVDRETRGEGPFTLEVAAPDGGGEKVSEECAAVVVATGKPLPYKVRPVAGLEFFEGYDEVDLDDLESFEGQRVLVLGKGNSAMEVVDRITNAAATVHVGSRHSVRMSFLTHYVGDVRARNARLFDHYQLKTLDALVVLDAAELNVTRDPGSGRLRVEHVVEPPEDGDRHAHADEWAGYDLAQRELSEPPRQSVLYDRVVSCTGWRPDTSVFGPAARPSWTRGVRFPRLTRDYEAEGVPGLYFAGALMHGRDLRRRSSGGFVHGFRYLVRALHRSLQERRHGVPWPSSAVPVDRVADRIVERVNSDSAAYQMFGVIGDAVLLPREEGADAVYLEGVLVDRVTHTAPANETARWSGYLVVTLEYGRGFTGEQVFSERRAVGEAADAALSRFLHPVVREYSVRVRQSRFEAEPKPRLVSEMHMLEELDTNWNDEADHVTPLRNYLAHVKAGTAREYREFCPLPLDSVMHHDTVKDFWEQMEGAQQYADAEGNASVNPGGE